MVVVCATSVHVFYRTSVRSNVCSLAVWRVVCYVRARSFVCDHSHSHGHCDHGRTCRAHVVSVRHVVTVAVVAITSWRPGCGCGIACLRWRPGRDVVV